MPHTSVQKLDVSANFTFQFIADPSCVLHQLKIATPVRVDVTVLRNKAVGSQSAVESIANGIKSAVQEVVANLGSNSDKCNEETAATSPLIEFG
jgi:hypothetical protein